MRVPGGTNPKMADTYLSSLPLCPVAGRQHRAEAGLFGSFIIGPALCAEEANDNRLGIVQ